MDLKNLTPAQTEQAKDILTNITTRKQKTQLLTSELLTCIIEQFGGTKSFAKIVHTEFNSAKPGTMMRSRMVEGIMKLFMAHTARAPDNTNVGEFTEEELKAAIAEILSGN